MPIAKEPQTFEPAPAGTHIARCFGCVSLGTQHSEQYADAFKVMLMFELPFEQIGEPPKPMTVSKEYTLSLSKKSNLRKHLDSWRGRPFTPEELAGFEVSNVVGAPCQLTITHAQSSQGQTYAKIVAITGLAKGMKCPEQVHPSISYEITDGNEKASETFRQLPEWIQKKIKACEEWTHPTAEPAALPEPDQTPSEPPFEDDDVPF